MAIDSGLVLHLYGCRKTIDVDFISLENPADISEQSDIQCHNSYLQLYKFSPEDLIYSPSNYFIYRDLKFLSLSNVRYMKSLRREPKDLVDLKLIHSIQYPNLFLTAFLRLFRLLLLFKTKLFVCLVYCLSRTPFYSISPLFRGFKRLKL